MIWRADVIAARWNHKTDMLRLTDPLVLPLVAPPLRDAVTALWTLDARLGELARAGREPALRQIRLAWWSEQLTGLAAASAPAEPLLQRVARDLLPVIDSMALSGLADAWVAEAIEEADGAERGAALFALTARLLGQGDGLADAGRGWAMVERGVAGETAAWPVAAALLGTVRLNRLPRPLAAVTAVARRIARQGGTRSAGREQWLLFRVGLIGR